MNDFGNWTTIDCPTKNEEEALIFLNKLLKPLNSEARLKMNPHDFGAYPSFEIDCYDEAIDYNPEIDEEDPEENKDLATRHEELIDKLNEVEKKYIKKFEEWL